MYLSTNHLVPSLPFLTALTSAASFTSFPLTTLLQTSTQTTGLSIHAPIDTSAPDPKYNTNYPGPVHDKEWTYYHTQYSPDWFRANLDSITATTCLCSSSPSLGAYNQVASFIRWDYHSHFHNKTYSMHHICGPAQAIVGDNHCWSTATGSNYHGTKSDKGLTYCMFQQEDGQKFCVNWAVAGKRWMTFHGHKREFDYEGIYTWVPEVRPERVDDVCAGKCGDLFGMGMDVEGDHDPSFIKTWFPPKPIPWT